MHLRIREDEVLVWFNRRAEPVVARLPEGEWHAGFNSDPENPAQFAGGAATLQPRSVVALLRGPAEGD